MAAHTAFALGLHVDHFGPSGQNAGIFYNDGATGWRMMETQFSLPAGEEINVLFNLAERRFRVIDSLGNLVYQSALPDQWGNPNNPDEWWYVGDHWTDNIYSASFQLLGICYAR